MQPPIFDIPKVVITSPKNLEIFDNKYYSSGKGNVFLNFSLTFLNPPGLVQYDINLKNKTTNVTNIYSYKTSTTKSKYIPLQYVFDSTLPNGTYEVYVTAGTAAGVKGTSIKKTFTILKDQVDKQYSIPLPSFAGFAATPFQQSPTPPATPSLPSSQEFSQGQIPKANAPFIPPSPEKDESISVPVPIETDKPKIIFTAPKNIPLVPLNVIPSASPKPDKEVIIENGNITVEKLNKNNNNIIFQIPPLKTHLYHKLKNKVLFEIDKFFPVLNYDAYNINNLKGNKQLEKTVNNIIDNEFFKTTTATIYKTETIPKELGDIVNKNNLYKTLNISSGKLWFNNFLEVNKDYYFIIKGNHLSKSGKINLQKYSNLHKVKIIKDEELYFIENTVIANFYSFLGNESLVFKNQIDDQKTKTILNKAFIEPLIPFKSVDINKINSIADLNSLFNSTSPGFNSAKNDSKYIKIRITSKKSNKKIDLNLNYNFLPTLQQAKYVGELQNKDVKKLEYYAVISKEQIDMAENVGLGQQLLFFVNTIEDYIKQNNLTFIIDRFAAEGIEIKNFSTPFEYVLLMANIINKNNYPNDYIGIFTQKVR